MAQQKVWKALRGGATFAVGFSLFGVAIAVGYGAQMLLGQDLILRSLTVIFPAASIVLGAEIVLNFLLDVYRPRLTGEDPHAAFDSRLLGLLAAPDKIAENVGEALNYQFGVRVTETWFYSLLRRWWLALVAMCVLVGWLMTSLVVIEPHQRALIVTNGAIELDSDGRATEVGPGLHLKLPWPLARVSIPEFRTEDADGNEIVRQTSTGVRTVNLGTNPALESADAILWTNDHTAEEVFNLVQPTRITSAIEGMGLLSEQAAVVAGLGAGLASIPEMRGNEPGRAGPDGADESLDDSEAAADLSLVAIESPMTWAVGDLLAYEVLAVPGDRERVIRAMGQRALLLHAGGESIDEILVGDRQAFVAGLEREIASGMDSLSRVTLEAQLGPRSASALGEGRTAIELLNVGTGNVHPPREVAASFERVVQAAQIVETRIATAETEKIKVLSSVAGSVTRAEAIVDALGETDALRDSAAAIDELARQEQVVRAMIEGAGGEAGTLLLNASAMRWEQHMGERGRAALYQGQLAAFVAAPAVFRSQLYFDAISEVMNDTRVFWLSESLSDSLTVLDLKAEQAVDVFDENIGAAQQVR
ncbi:MAG: SPFH domain-containing protein [Planctomycetota bacterium]